MVPFPDVKSLLILEVTVRPEYPWKSPFNDLYYQDRPNVWDVFLTRHPPVARKQGKKQQLVV